ncbi:hypothetical protein E5288_WYG009806 [Bos mutus]|uniref:Uncharacterized protein n=1 Tax=Bos mutus TaxID=72004 RepID=A0A6B0QXL3_9CETA|nr:hypothetical protein [Bos mutus]
METMFTVQPCLCPAYHDAGPGFLDESNLPIISQPEWTWVLWEVPIQTAKSQGSLQTDPRTAQDEIPDKAKNSSLHSGKPGAPLLPLFTAQLPKQFDSIRHRARDPNHVFSLEL